MKIAAVYCVYNEEDYIEYSIKSIYDFVDKIVICLGEAPYTAYNPNARQIITRKDATGRIIDRLAKNDNKFHIIRGVWNSEIDHRNEGMKYCVENGFDYYLLIDADEVYRKDHLKNIAEEINANPKVGTFIVKCAIFWRSFRYGIPANRVAWCPRRIFKITRYRKILGIKFPYSCRFIGENKTNSLGEVYHIPTKRAIFYHFSYAKTSESMREKLSSFSHAHEILPGWYDNVWVKWADNRKMTNIHPTNPDKFPAAEEIDLQELPDVMKTHPFYAREIIG